MHSWHQGYSFFKQRPDPEDVFLCVQSDQLPRIQHTIEGRQALGGFSPNPVGTQFIQTSDQRRHHGFGDFVLHSEDILEFAVVAFGPDVVARRCLHKLDTDAYPLTCFANAALNHIRDTQFSTDHGHVNGLVLEGERGISGDNEQASKAAETSNDVLGNSIRKVLLFHISRHVDEGQDGDGGFIRWHRCG